jgi:hypothetical protein
MFVVERVSEGYRVEDKSTMVAETKELLVDNLMELFADWYEPSDYPERKDEGIIAIKDDYWKEGDWYDWVFDRNYLINLDTYDLVRYFDNLSSVEDLTLVYARENYLSVNLYGYEDEETGEKVYDTESIQQELAKQFIDLTGQDWYEFMR